MSATPLPASDVQAGPHPDYINTTFSWGRISMESVHRRTRWRSVVSQVSLSALTRPVDCWWAVRRERLRRGEDDFATVAATRLRPQPRFAPIISGPQSSLPIKNSTRNPAPVRLIMDHNTWLLSHPALLVSLVVEERGAIQSELTRSNVGSICSRAIWNRIANNEASTRVWGPYERPGKRAPRSRLTGA